LRPDVDHEATNDEVHARWFKFANDKDIFRDLLAFTLKLMPPPRDEDPAIDIVVDSLYMLKTKMTTCLVRTNMGLTKEIIRGKLKHYVDSRRRRSAIRADVDPAELPAAKTQSPVEFVIDKEMLDLLPNAMQSLSQQQREFLARRFNGATLKELAEIYGGDTNRMFRRLKKILDLVRQAIGTRPPEPGPSAELTAKTPPDDATPEEFMRQLRRAARNRPGLRVKMSTGLLMTIAVPPPKTNEGESAKG
jgi:hypothetical protein